MTMVLRLVCVLLFFGATLFSDSDHVRQVQEELRKRNLFFGDIDGQLTPQLTGALKRYQVRKGFEPTGAIDAPTVASLQIVPAGPLNAADTRAQSQTQGAGETVTGSRPAAGTEIAASERNAADGDPDGGAVTDLPVVPEPPAEAPSPAQDLTPERVNRFVETYLSDGETDDIGLQVWFYRFPVKYFDHGMVDQDFVVRDTRAYVKRWPERKYALRGPITFAASGNEGETMIEFTIDYTVKNGSRVKSGRTKNFWTVRTEGEDMKIVAIREEHLGG